MSSSCEQFIIWCNPPQHYQLHHDAETEWCSDVVVTSVFAALVSSEEHCIFYQLHDRLWLFYILICEHV